MDIVAVAITSAFGVVDMADVSDPPTVVADGCPFRGNQEKPNESTQVSTSLKLRLKVDGPGRCRLVRTRRDGIKQIWRRHIVPAKRIFISGAFDHVDDANVSVLPIGLGNRKDFGARRGAEDGIDRIGRRCRRKSLTRIEPDLDTANWISTTWAIGNGHRNDQAIGLLDDGMGRKDRETRAHSNQRRRSGS